MKKAAYALYLIFIITFSSIAQPPSVTKYDLKKKRLLIQSSSIFLYNSNQGAVDVDSSVVLACKIYKLPLSLAYDEGFNDGSYLIGSDLIEKGNINSVLKVLAQSKGEDRIKLLLQLGNFYLFKSGAKPQDLQNALLYIKQAVDVSNQLKIKKWQNLSLLLLGKYYYQANNQAEGKKCFLQIIDKCRKQNDKAGLAQALDAYGTLLFNLDPEKEKILTEAISLYASLGMEEKRIENYMKITVIYFWGKKVNEAKKRLYQNLVDLRKIGFTHQQFAESTIVYLELGQHNMKSAFYYALKSVKRMESEKDYAFADIFYMRLGDVYNLYGHYEEALELYTKSIKIGRQNLNIGTWYKSFYGAVAALSLKGKTKEALNYINSMTAKYPPVNTFDKMFVAFIKANCYDQLKNYVQAEKYFKEVAYFAKQLNTPETIRDVVHQYTMIALFYIKTNRLEQAKFYTDKIYAIGKESNSPRNSEYFQALLFKTDSINGNYKGALEHFQRIKKITDSIHGADKNRQIEELKIEYETKNKEQKIKLLNNQSRLQESELQKSQLLNNLSIWSLILLLIIIVLLYSRYRLKQRNHAKLELKEKEINQKNINLRHLLDEKEWLLKEIHHRVKNNLQTVISLLNSQSAYLDNDMALSAIKNSQHRIHSMSLIHQKLYNSENISTINMPNYIKELVEYLKDSFSLGQRIRFEIKIDPLELDVAQAVPLGLILNEAITNSIKYAFPDDRSGMVYITLETIKENLYLMTIADNGIGIDIDFSNKKVNSFGMSLIKGLSDDLEAKFSMENNNGTILKIEFSQEFPLNQKRELI
ncbi:two-component sensor histidine kinase [Flavobacterium sp. 90]|uniref:sensor histidine kinase n=1 Tax=unclassified Flavobacterium TaxID=196869 RepID=UPI000EB5B26D|nr:MULTISPECIES: sensor histidine kinase [unclassified Flavobacterium]RKR09102.1 two-component sensor histidine kinase [Flavobacterium sp. 81]TCK52885.1 two-component sensor histidine kinase [Flavobacterium sp. 90]